MVTDGFTVNDRGYLLASSMASQQPHTDQVLVYNRAALTTCLLELTPLATTVGTVLSFDLTYKNITSNISHTVVTGTVDAICDALEILIDASAAGIAGAAVAPDNATATKLIFTGGTTGEPVMLSNFDPAQFKVLDTSTDAGIATDLAAAAAAHSFFDFVIDSFSEAENNAAAAWAEANGKMFYAASGDTTDITASAGTGIGADFLAALYNNSSDWFSTDMPGNLPASIVARQAAFDPGTSAYLYQQLSGPEADALTATHIANAKGKNVNLYALNDSTAHTWFGRAGSGRSLRVQRVIHFLDARIREAILSTFLGNEYIPMSDKGFALMEAAVRSVLSGLASAGIAEQEFTVTVPKKASMSSANLVAGLLTPLKFSVTIPNDMQKVVVQGTVSL